MVKRFSAMVMALGAFCLLFSSTASGVEVLLNTDFGKCPVKRASQIAGSFKGVLPAGWGDSYVGWNKSRVKSKVVTEQGKSFLRFTVSKIGQAGFPQFVTGMGGLVDGGYYRMTVRARNNSTGPLSLGFRMSGKPYQYRYEVNVEPSPKWVEKSWSFRLSNKDGAGLGFFMLPCGVGTIDVASIRVEKLVTPAEIATFTPRPPKGTKNFFRNSRLPLGMQAGWSLERMSSVCTAAADPKCIGPSGSPALRVESNGQTDSFTGSKRMVLYCEPFQVADPAAKAYVSVSFKGSGKWHCSLVPSGVYKIVEAADKWNRVTMEFTPNVAEKAYTLVVIGSGTLWIDSLSAWQGDKDQPYQSAGDCEVALGMPKSEIAETRIQFANEPAALVYRVTGDCEGAILKAKVTNVYGTEKRLRSIRLSAATLSGKISFGVFPKTPYGQFRTEAWVERKGKRISPMNEMVVTRLKRPVFWGKDAPASPFGAHFLSTDSTIKIMKAGGINWARLHDAGMEYICWWWLEPEKGKWTFFDKDIQRYRANNIKLFAQLGTAPKWASYLSKTDTGRKNPSYHDHYFQPLNQEDFANYVKTVVTRYKGVIDEYFVWNEPYYESWWGVKCEKGKHITSKNPHADFAKLMATAYKAVKAVDPTIKVSGFNTCAWDLGANWTKGVYDAGGMASSDIIDYHFYTSYRQGYPRSHTGQALGKAVGYILKNEGGSIDQPIYMSEGNGRPGFSNHQLQTEWTLNTGIYKNAIPFDAGEDPIARADVLCKYVLDLLGNKVSKVFLYSTHTRQSIAGKQSAFCVLVGGDGYPHPSLAAHSNMALHIESKKFVKTIKVSDGVHAYIFSDGKQSTAVISGKPGAAAYQLPGATRLKVVDLFGNPLHGANAVYKGRLVYASAAVTPEAMETLFQ